MRFARLSWLCVMATVASGCALTHDLQPHRLWRWNRGPGASSDPFFSVSDASVRKTTANSVTHPTSAWRPTHEATTESSASEQE